MTLYNVKLMYLNITTMYDLNDDDTSAFINSFDTLLDTAGDENNTHPAIRFSIAGFIFIISYANLILWTFGYSGIALLGGKLEEGYTIGISIGYVVVFGLFLLWFVFNMKRGVTFNDKMLTTIKMEFCFTGFSLVGHLIGILFWYILHKEFIYPSFVTWLYGTILLTLSISIFGMIYYFYKKKIETYSLLPTTLN